MYIQYIYIYIYIYNDRLPLPLGGTTCLTLLACLTRPRLLYAFFAASRITMFRLLQSSPLLQNTCIGQVALDKWFALVPGNVQRQRRLARLYAQSP